MIETSIQAAESIAGTVDQLRARVLCEIRASSFGAPGASGAPVPRGMTCDEVEVRLDMRHQTASARVNELMERGDIRDSGERRRTRSNRNAVAWVAVEKDAEVPAVAISPKARQGIVLGDCLEVLKRMRACSVDAVVSDPPYGLSREPDIAEVLRHWLAGDAYEHGSAGFMGCSWDSFVPGPEYWREVYRVLKPGGHLLAFSSTRTDDLLSIAIRFAGFERRDEIRAEGLGSLAWLYGTGFPKSKNLGKATGDEALEGVGTALKGSWEPILVFRKPVEGTTIENALKYGTGGLNIDACRIGAGRPTRTNSAEMGYGGGNLATSYRTGSESGRWPANFVLSHLEECEDECAPDCPVAQLNAQTGSVGADSPVLGTEPSSAVKSGNILNPRKRLRGVFYNDKGKASRFFYCAKPNRSERDAGLESFPALSGGEATERADGSAGTNNPRAGAGRRGGMRNPHKTVKPIGLMRWLVRLVTPPGGIVLDPFAGSGTTGCACALEDLDFVGIERDEVYVRVAELRITHWRRAAGHKDVDSEGTAGLTVSPSPRVGIDRGSEQGDEIERERETETLTEREEENDMAQLPKHLADQAGKARAAGGGVFVQHGDYIMMIKRWFYQKIQDECIVLEMVAVESRKKIVYEGKNKVEVEPNEPGSDCSTVANFSGNSKMSAPANSRAPVLGLFGFTENQVADEKISDTLVYVTSDAQPAAGMLVGCSTFPKEIRSNKGNYITGLDWSCVAPPKRGVNSDEAVKARLDAYARGPLEMVKVALAQLAEARAAGHAPGLPSTEIGSAPEDDGKTTASAPPQLPKAGPPALPKKERDPFEGWTPHPDDPENYFYNVKNELKTRAEILAGK